MKPQNTINKDSNNPYAYQQIPSNLQNQGDPASVYQQQQQQQQQQMQFGNNPQQYQNPSQQNYSYNPPNDNPQPGVPFPQPGVPISPQQYPYQPTFVPVGPQSFTKPVMTYCSFSSPQIDTNTYKDRLLQESIDNLILQALREIWASLPLNFQSINKKVGIFSFDYVTNYILKPLTLANPSIPTEVIQGGNVLCASRILHQGIRKSSLLIFIITIIFVALIVMFQIIYSDINDYYYNYNDYEYQVTIQIIGLIWMSIQPCLDLIGVGYSNFTILRIGGHFQTLFIIYSLVLFICGVITVVTTSSKYGSEYNYFYIIIGVLFITGAMAYKIFQSRLKFFMLRLFVLLKLLPEDQINQKICQ